MGKEINKDQYTDTDVHAFSARLDQQLLSLQDVMQRPGFGQESLKIGAELELYLLDNDAKAAGVNQQVLERLDDPMFQPEINRYNLELNLNPISLAHRPFSQLQQELESKLAELETTTQAMNITALPIGILPTLTENDLGRENMTDRGRYHMLAKQLYHARGEPFKIEINGDEQLQLKSEDVTLEGANTSLQIHLMVEPERFTSVFNAAQLTLPLVTAIAANSPILLGHRLWHETRIALFKQSLDCRIDDDVPWHQPTRVSFGYGWLRSSPWELYAEAVALYSPILPELVEPPEFSASGLPLLSELNTHLGTLWPWHRPVYCAEGNGHVRIEFRAIPAGPTPIDMAANAAFAIGLATGFAEQIENYLPKIPFRFAEYNFYRAAQSGLNSKILWPLVDPNRPNETPIVDVIHQALPIAIDGLKKLGVDDDEIDTYMQVITTRLTTKMNGARWMRTRLDKIDQQSANRFAACQQLVKDYIANVNTGKPVATWDL